MKIAIDESGDSGRKFFRGSSRWFILAAVIVPDNMFCGPTCQAVSEFRKSNNGGRELHFSHNSHQQHVEFLDFMHGQDYIFGSVCIDKKRIAFRRPYVLRSKMSLLKFAFEQLFEQLKPWLDDPVVLMDTSGSRHFNRALSRHIMRLYGHRHKGDAHTISQMRAVDSDSEPLVQLADYVAGAIHHHVDGLHNSTTFEQYVQDKGRIFYIR